jgi:hypothetical protein
MLKRGEEGRHLPLDRFSFALGHEGQQRFIG